MVQKKYADYVYTKRIKAERILKGLKVADMASKMGCSRGTYYNIEHGIKCPTIVDINKISEILGKPANYFFKLYGFEEDNQKEVN